MTTAMHNNVCLDWRQHQPSREYVQLCRTCLRELVGRLDDLERRLTALEPRPVVHIPDLPIPW